MAFDEETAIRRIRAQLLTATTLPLPAHRAWGNVQFDIPASDPDTSWLRETVQFVSEEHTATEQVTSRWRVVYDVFVASGSGTSLLSETTLAILEVFSPGQWLRGPPNECPLIVERSQRGLSRKDPDTDAWFMQAVELSCRAHVANPSLID